MTLWNSKSIDVVGMHLHWIIDNPTLTIHEKKQAILTADRTIVALMNIGRSIDDCNKRGHTILSWLIICQQLDEYVIEFIKKIVIKWKANINHLNIDGYTYLIWAAIFDRPCAVTLLLSLGANPNIEELPTKTPEYFAIQCDNQNALNALHSVYI